MTNKALLKSVSILLYMVLVIGAFVLARHKPLWNDEIYSQVASIEKNSTIAILGGGIGEGNNCPLFYLLQKGITSLLGYHTPRDWALGLANWREGDARDRIILRIQPVLLMSAVPIIVFYFLSRIYSLWTGLLSFVLTLSTSMFWRFWAEARPYGLWVMLSALQAVLFLWLLRREEDDRRIFIGLALVHLLLSLTVVFSASQIVLVSVLLLVFGQKEQRNRALLLAVPAAISVFYLTQAPQFKFWLEFSLEQYIRANIPRDRLYLAMIYVVYLVPFLIQLFRPSLKLYKDKTMLEALPFLFFFLGSCAAVAAVVQVFAWRASPVGTGFPVTERYFMNLIPVGVVCASVFVRTLLVSFRGQTWMQGIILTGTSALVIRAVIKVVPEIAGHYPLLFR